MQIKLYIKLPNITLKNSQINDKLQYKWLTSNVWAGYSPRLLRARYAARYSPSIYMCGSPKTRRYLLNKSSNTIIWRLNIRQVNKDLYVEVESHARLSINEKMCGSVQTTVWKKTCIILAWKTHVRIGWKYSKTCDKGTPLYPGQSVPTWQVPSSQVCPNNMKTPYFKW